MAIKRTTAPKISKADKMRAQIKRKHKKETKESNNNIWIPGGSVLFNLSCSDHWTGAYKPGTMANIIGDSSSGKSILVLSGLAAVANMTKFNDYRLIYDDAEFADSFDHEHLFGPNFVERIEYPGGSPDTCSTTIEQFYDHMIDAFDDGSPFIYVMDSFDAIDADAEIKKELENREHRKAGNLSKIKGSFQATKQKKSSQMFRHITGKLKTTKSLLIIISQTRDNLNAMSFAKKYRAGGRALKFYASIEAWLANAGKITKTIHGTNHKIGVNSIGKIEKNKYTGKLREAAFPIYYDYGIDDITACIKFLTENKYWKMKKKTVIAPELDVEFSVPKLIEFIEEKKKKRELILFKTTQKCWNGIENSLKLNRRSKF